MSQRHIAVTVLGLLILCICFFVQRAECIILSGPISASSVTVSGDVTMSSVTVSSLTINNQLNVQGISNIQGLVLQSILVKSTNSYTTNSTTLTPITGMSASITPSSANNYIRISLSGMLEVSFSDAQANLSIKRNTTDLGNGSLSTAYGFPGAVSTGITIIDFTHDTSSHTYIATLDVNESTQTATFTAGSLGYFLIQEIAQ